MNKLLLPIVASAVLALVACDKKSDSPAQSAAPAPVAAPAAPAASASNADALDPSKATLTAPEVFKAKLVTTKGDMVIEVHRAWTPHGADRFYNLVKMGYYTDVTIFRVVNGFMAQAGMHGDPAVQARWQHAGIPDDPNVPGVSNKPGYVTFAKTGMPNSRTVQIFFNMSDNSGLDAQNFTPFGKVIEGAQLIPAFYQGYGEAPDQGMIAAQGNQYLRANFPNLDVIKSATIVP